MDEVKSAIVATLDANQGVCTWQQILDAVGTGGRRLLVRAMTELESEGIAKRQNRYDPEQGGVFEVVKIVS